MNRIWTVAEVNEALTVLNSDSELYRTYLGQHRAHEFINEETAETAEKDDVGMLRHAHVDANPASLSLLLYKVRQRLRVVEGLGPERAPEHEPLDTRSDA